MGTAGASDDKRDMTRTATNCKPLAPKRGRSESRERPKSREAFAR